MGKYLHKKTLIILLLSGTLIAPILLQTCALTYGIQSKTIDTAGNAGRDVSIALDSKGNPHIAYNNGNQTGVKYAYWNGTAWKIQLIEDGGASGSNGLWSSIKLDQNDHPHIIYLDLDSTYHTYLRYATWDGQSWKLQTVDSAASWHTSLALDLKGYPHITYCGVASLNYASWNGEKWVIETIDPGILYVNDALGAYSSLQFDSNGNPCVAYSDEAGGRLKYASYDGSKWNIETVDSGVTVTPYNSLALDSNNNPLILYFFNDGLRYAAHNSNGWAIQTVDTNPDTYHYIMSCPKLLLDSKGTPNICYIDQYRNTAVKYAFLNGSSWVIYGLTDSGHTQHSLAMALDANNTVHLVQDNGYTIEYFYFNPASLGTPHPIPEPTPTPIPAPFTTPTSAAGVPNIVDHSYGGWYTSVALDNAGYPQISYFSPDYGLKYAHSNGSVWRIESVDVSGWYGLYTSIVADSSGYPHIAYYDNWNSALKYAHWNGTQWSKQTLDTNGGSCPSIVLDSNGYPAIAYRNSLDYLKYAHWTGSQWDIQVADKNGNAEFMSLALDSAGNPHMSYYDWRNGDLKYASWTGSSWSIQTIDSSGDVGYSTSLEIDANDNPHISYLDNTNRVLKYATNSGSGWNIQAIEYVGNIQTRIQNWINTTSLALDVNGYPHITYFDGVRGNLRYTFWNGTMWNYQIADSSWNTGYSSSLVLDSSGRAHISYYDDSSKQLRYVCSINSSGFLPNVLPNPTPNLTPSPTPIPQATSTQSSSSSSTKASSSSSPNPTNPPSSCKTTFLDLTCKNTDALAIQITGQLTFDNSVGVSGVEIMLAYSSDNGLNWINLPSAQTDNSGYFSIDSNLPVTGVYLIKATWEGNSAYMPATKSINTVLTSTDTSNILSITSNSTVSAVTFDSANKTLSFSVDGNSGTTGYIKFYMAKTLIDDIAGMQIYLDDTELPYTLESQGDTWLVTFTYHHSRHVVEIVFASPVVNSAELVVNWAIASVVALILIAATAIVTIIRLKKRKSVR